MKKLASLLTINEIVPTSGLNHCQSYSNRNSDSLIQFEFYLNKIDYGLSLNQNVSKSSNVSNIIGSYFCN